MAYGNFRRNFNRYKKKEIPFKVGDKFNVKVNRLTVRGDGYVKIQGISVFVKGVSLGYEGEITITRLGPTYAVAEASQ